MMVMMLLLPATEVVVEWSGVVLEKVHEEVSVDRGEI